MTFFVFAILIFLLYQAAAQASVPDWNPPRRFDHPFRGRVEIVDLSADYMRLNGDTKVMGFTWGQEAPRFCRIFLNRRWNKYRRSTIRHEIGHCNGWPGDHPK